MKSKTPSPPKRKRRVRILNAGNRKVVVLTKEAQGTMYYRGE